MVMDELMGSSDEATIPNTTAIREIESQRAVAEVQAAMILAKRFPRDEQRALDKILLACQRPLLAENAIYSYARGGTEITGPSIRLAEAIAQTWGNLQFGIRELDQRNGESSVEAFAWDLESNTKQVKIFQVKHVRHTRKGSYTLDDPRDIYETIANNGARRLRACILGIIPGDIVEAATTQCEETMKAKADTGPEAIKKLVDAFEALGVAKLQIEKRIQRRLETITAAQLVGMRKIYNSMKDGMSTGGDWFEPVDEGKPESEKPKTGTEKAKDALSGKKKEPGPPKEKEEPPKQDHQQEPAKPSVPGLISEAQKAELFELLDSNKIPTGELIDYLRILPEPIKVISQIPVGMLPELRAMIIGMGEKRKQAME